MLNHWYHHRGQLLVYLRMHDVPLPSVYGPTADENPFAELSRDDRGQTPRRFRLESARGQTPMTQG